MEKQTQCHSVTLFPTVNLMVASAASQSIKVKLQHSQRQLPALRCSTPPVVSLLLYINCRARH